MREKAAAVLRVEILKEIFQDFALDAAVVFLS